MDKKLPLIFLSLCVALGLCCSAPGLACAKENSAPAEQTDKSTSSSAPQKSSAQRSGEKKGVSAKANRREGKQKEKNSKGIHAPAWAFGGEAQSRDAWREGTSSNDLQKRAVGDDAPKEKSVNTTASINSALKGPPTKEEHKSGMAVSVGQEDSAWRKKGQHELEADENLPMQSRHVVRAYADVDAGDDLSIRVGPELILKDEQRERTNANKQPESALGLGMQFKLDF